MKIHQLTIHFNVTPEVRRFVYVYVYVIEATKCYLVDSGVCGSEAQIIAFLQGKGEMK